MNTMYSEKRKMLIIKNEFKFCFHKELKNNIERWKCNQNQCKAYIKIGKITKLLIINVFK
ncbi:Uncharacterized protein FWK35_00023668 [Aphis craccivora]|uniref:FLYWCH-type domain-containing protein n=1 Tax=Aphis craccivora TaxID=307492 RepID=A0A6G0Y1H1_APHCR|nr:Uncharacterized protein FWK35_00023668 [Aphis craccivora]